MYTYTTLDGQRIELTDLTAEEEAYWQKCIAAYRQGMPHTQFTELSQGCRSPLVRATGGWVTRAVMDQPLFRATRDLEDRIGIAQGYMAPDPGDDLDRDPFTGERLPAADAAQR